MAGNTLSATINTSATSSISGISCVIQIRQPNAGITANCQVRLSGSYTTSVGGPVYVSVTSSAVGSAKQGPTFPTNEDGGNFDTGWVPVNGLSCNTGSTTFNCDLKFGGGPLIGSKTLTGTVYWTESTPVQPTYYTITYNANGGSSTPASQTFKKGTSIKLAAAITRSGYSFAGWNTKSDGTGTNYQAGGTYTFGWNWTLYAKWVSSSGGGGSTTNTTLKIYCTNSSDVCYASTSDVQGTSALNNGTREVTLSCSLNGTTYKPVEIEYMPDASGTKYPNSFALRIHWGSSTSNIVAQNSVIFSPATASTGAIWNDHAKSTRILDEDTVWTDQPTQIDVKASASGSTSYGTVSRLTLNDYYIAGVGTSNGTSNTATGSYNTPAKWYSRYSNPVSSSDSTQIGTLKQYRKLSWTKPSSGTPLYYVIALWKGYSTNYAIGSLAGTIVANGGATSCLDTNPFWQGGFDSHYFIKYTIHAIYSNGVNPTFKNGHDQAQNGATYGMGKSAIETHSIWWQLNFPPATPYRIRFYAQDKTTLLKDSNGNDYDYYAPTGAAVSAPSDVQISGVDNTNAYTITGWYVKSGSGSWGTSAVTNLGTVGSSDLSFAQVVSKKTYTITYLNTNLQTVTATIEYGDGIIIDNADGVNPTVRQITANYTIPNPTKPGYKFMGYMYDITDHTFEATWISDKYVYVYDGTSWQKYKAYVYNGGTWKPATYFVYMGDAWV